MSRHLTAPPGAALCWGTRLPQIAGSETRRRASDLQELSLHLRLP